MIRKGETDMRTKMVIPEIIQNIIEIFNTTDIGIIGIDITDIIQDIIMITGVITEIEITETTIIGIIETMIIGIIETTIVGIIEMIEVTGTIVMMIEGGTGVIAVNKITIKSETAEMKGKDHKLYSYIKKARTTAPFK